MGRKNRRSNRKMNRRSKRSNMRGGSNITMVVKNVGTQVVYLSWYNPKTRKWSGPEARGGGGGWSVPTYTGTQWRVNGNGKELSWVLADDDGSKQVIHVDLSPSKCSLTWNPIDEEVDGDAAIEAELEATRRELEALRGDLGGEPEPEQQARAQSAISSSKTRPTVSKPLQHNPGSLISQAYYGGPAYQR
jgi:hypothetical protein